MLSTAYRAWLDWRADVRLPMVALGSPNMAELLEYVKFLVSSSCGDPGHQ